ncbi:MAG TPA: gas vesicle protein GvpJ [Jatrophihabitans sp.]|jgi:hypothetical protein|nr:gas vesicle protein GvpJ [Jatrophihabitans sp.]
MTPPSPRSRGGYIDRPSPSSLADVVEIILDKGLVIDAYVRVSVVGIELLTIDARVVIASVDTYLRFAEATNRLDLSEHAKDLGELTEDVMEAGAKTVVERKIDKAADRVSKALGGSRNR